MKFSCGVTRRVLAALAVAAAFVLMSACSAPGVYPTILAEPAPRDDTTLTPDQVKQATDSLISDRDRLCSEAMATSGPTAAAPAAPNCAPRSTATIRTAAPGAKP